MNELKQSLIFQFDIAWQLLEYHLKDLENEEALWKPTPNSLHVDNLEGVWKADWPETETYEIGPPSIAWTTWHIIFWWSMVMDYSFGEGTLTKDKVYWLGDMEAVRSTLFNFHDQWRNILETISDEELVSTDFTKWPFEERPFYELASWLNIELMKNASEIGSGRFLYATKDKLR
jgi:hypothetical protein